MREIIKKAVIVIAIVIVIVGLYFGAYLPFKQAKAFISVVRSPRAITSVEDLKRSFNGVLGAGSPAARDEIAGFVVDQLTNIIRSRPSGEVGGLIVDYAEEVARPVLTNPGSPELTKMLLKMGIIHQTAWSLYRNDLYAQRAEELYLEGLRASPDRPQFLYGLFDLYLSEGEQEKAAGVREKIIRFWPTDLRIQEAVL